MDQDSFRQLLQTPRTTTPSVLGGGSRPRIHLAAPPPKKKSVDASQPAFKPRNVKKTQELKYRDRASERRVGDGNDYAQIEAVLEDFERKNAGEDKDKVEAQRKYLGGDSEHSILVKGLDFALLEQNKARAVLTNEDVDALDEAYRESSSSGHQRVPKKRTREDIIRELKEARGSEKPGNGAAAPKTAEEEARLLEEAKQKGKFKPIGFKPIGSASEGKKKKKKTDEAGAEQKKKKRKVEIVDGSENKDAAASTSMPPPSVPVKSNEAPKPQEIVELFDDDFDIFADAGEYEGLDFDDDDKDEGTVPKPSRHDLEVSKEPSSSTASRRWIPTDDKPSQASQHPTAAPSSSTAHPERSRLSPPKEPPTSEDEDMEDEQPMRLVPLSSSAIPSIKELLAMDKAAGSHAKNKKRKDKKKAGDGDHDEEPKKKSTEEKVDRDYKRLKTYTEKKAAAENR